MPALYGRQDACRYVGVRGEDCLRQRFRRVSPLTHLLASWIIAVKTTDNPRDCRLFTLAGILPDVDGLGLAVDIASASLGYKPTQYYGLYHHYLTHGAVAGVAIAVLLACFARQRLRVALLALVVFHLHLLCDFVGSRGPSPTDLWPIFYLSPFDKEPMWVWKGQWWLDGLPNRFNLESAVEDHPVGVGAGGASHSSGSSVA